MIRLLEGRVGSGKTRRILGEVVEATRQGLRTLLLVPEQTTLETELMLASRLETPGFLTTEVLSPSRLMQRVNEAAGGLAGRVLIDERGRAAALRAALHELETSLLVYRGCAGRSGFVEMLADFMQECSQGDIGPTELRLAADALPEGLTRMKLYDLAALNDRYLDLLRGRFLDTGEAVDLFTRNVHLADFLKGARVYVDGFDILPPRTIRMLTALATSVEEMTIALTLPAQGEEMGALFMPVAQSRARLCALAEELSCPVAREALPREAYHSPELGHLERAWDMPRPPEYTGAPQDIALYALPTPLAECEAAADAMLAMNRDLGIPFEAMACVSGDEAGYAPSLRQALTERGIPFFQAQAMTALEHPLVRYWLCAMESATTGYRYESMRGVLRSGWCGVCEDIADQLLNDAYARGLRGGGWQRPGLVEELTAPREVMLAPLLAYERRVKSQKSAREMAHAAYLLLEESGAYPRLIQEAARLREGGEGVAADHHAQVWGQMLDLLSQIADILGEREIPHAEFLLALRSGLATAQLSALPPMPGQVTVTAASRIKGCDIQALFVLGLNDGVLPGVGGNEALLGAQERQRVNQAAGDTQIHLNGPLERDQIERFSLYAAITLATRKLHLSFAQAGEDGGALQPSAFVSRLKNIFPGLYSKSRLPGPLSGGATALWEAAGALLASSVQEEYRQVLCHGFEEPALAKEASLIRRALSPAEPAPPLGSALWEKLCGGLRMGVTRVERFALCPCQCFIQSGLRPVPLYEPGLRPMDTGTFYHDALDALTSAVAARREGWAGIGYEEIARLMGEIAAPKIQELAGIPGYEGGRAAARLRELGRTLVKTAQVVAYHLKGSAFLPVAREISFGEGQSAPPLALPLPDGRVALLEGRIDRVDLYRREDGQNFLRVIDYKSGDARWLLEDHRKGLMLQLPIYALVAEGIVGAKTAGFFYSKIADPLVEGDVSDPIPAMAAAHKLSGAMLRDAHLFRAMDSGEGGAARTGISLNRDGDFSKSSNALAEEDFRALLEGSRDTLSSLLQRMAGGEVAPAPAESGGQSACARCEYGSICRRGG